MSYKKKEASVTPFAQISNSADYFITQRPNTASVSWVTETAIGQNGYQFTGTGYIFGYIADISGSAGGQLMALAISDTSAPQDSWGKLDYGSTMRSACDDAFYSYDNRTEIYEKNKLSGGTAAFGQNSRINVIRMEP